MSNQEPMTVEAAKEFLKDANYDSSDLANSNSYFHSSILYVDKKDFIDTWLKAKDILSKQAQREEDAELVANLFNRELDTITVYQESSTGILKEVIDKILKSQP